MIVEEKSEQCVSSHKFIKKLGQEELIISLLSKHTKMIFFSELQLDGRRGNAGNEHGGIIRSIF